MRGLAWVLGTMALVGAVGCAGPDKLAHKSQDRLAEGDMWKAWQLATRALDKAPANPQARQAAAAAATTIADDWERRIGALAAVDSMAAAEEVLRFAEFRTGAIPYTTVQTRPGWAATETRLRQNAARQHYTDGVAAARSGRPKKAYGQFRDAMRFVVGFRDAAARADAAFEQAQTRVAIVPLQGGPGSGEMGRAVAAAWSDALLAHVAGEDTFTRILPASEVEQRLRVSELGSTTRADAIRIGARAGADRVVWGMIGPIDSHTSLQVFHHTVWRRMKGTDAAGHAPSHWVEVPIEVIARIRTMRVDLAYEVLSARGITLARESAPHTLEARAVWTSFAPEGDLDAYALVTDEFRAAQPERARQIEFEWHSAVGASTTLAQVLAARRASDRGPSDRAAALARWGSGAAFVFLQDLPAAPELAQAALAASWPQVEHSLVALDGVDDVDLHALSTGETDTP